VPEEVQRSAYFWSNPIGDHNRRHDAQKKEALLQHKNKLTRQANRTISKVSSLKKIHVRSQNQTAGLLVVEVAEVEAIAEPKQNSVDETETAMRVSLDEHLPPHYGGSE